MSLKIRFVLVFWSRGFCFPEKGKPLVPPPLLFHSPLPGGGVLRGKQLLIPGTELLSPEPVVDSRVLPGRKVKEIIALNGRPYMELAGSTA